MYNEKFSTQNILREKNKITFKKMRHYKCVSDFIIAVKGGISEGFTIFELSARTYKAFPNTCVPIAGIIDYYKSLGYEFIFKFPQTHFLSNCNFIELQELNADYIEKMTKPFDKIFKYSEPDQIYALSQVYVDSLSRLVSCEKGVLDGIIWCVNELMDNVIVHSEASFGFIMSQYHPKQKHIAFCVYDTGVGIFNSLKHSKYNPRNILEAISLSVREGISNGKGQGNGLFGLYEIVRLNDGSLTISTGSESIRLLGDGTQKTFSDNPYLSEENYCTAIDFQLDISKTINLKQAFQSIGGHNIIDLRLENMFDEDHIVYDVLDHCEGTATRKSGFHVRNDVINTIRRFPVPIILDFSRISSVSSSFIDEFISKMIVELGIVTFNNLIRLYGMSDTIRYLLERSTYMRIHQMWEEK